jgi:hypothetical protein
MRHPFIVTVEEFCSEWPYRVSAPPPGLIRRHSGSVGERANDQPSGVILFPPEVRVAGLRGRCSLIVHRLHGVPRFRERPDMHSAAEVIVPVSHIDLH